MEFRLKKIVLLDTVYDNVTLSDESIPIVENLLKVYCSDFEIYINPEMIVSLELDKSNTIKAVT